jgi:hypothetical protein
MKDGELRKRLNCIENLLLERRDNLLTVEAAAECLDISVSYLYKLTSG